MCGTIKHIYGLCPQFLAEKKKKTHRVNRSVVVVVVSEISPTSR